jgi:3-oxoacyl-[acyl-carrier protein] reductase
MQKTLRDGIQSMRLQDKVALITGGAQGIGRAIALGMGQEGAQVIVADLQAEKAETVAAELRALGAEALALDVNVASEQSVQRLAERTFERFGRVDILVNDAGVYLKAPVVSKSEEDWDRTLDVNLGGNFLCARAFVPAMRRQKSGRIISIASSIAHNGAREFADYAASKAAIIGFVKALARELGPDGITVNAICPGSANTDMPRRHRSEEETMARLRATPLGHVLEPEDIAGPILFLASDAAAYITGQTYNINCGTVMI